MCPDPHHPDFWDGDPDPGLDPDQIPFGPDDDEAQPEPGDFYFDDDPADE